MAAPLTNVSVNDAPVPQRIPNIVIDNRPIVLAVEKLNAGYRQERPALQNLTFHIHQGERIALVGPNGAGKSTLFKTLVGLIKPTSGTIAIHGTTNRQAVRQIAYVPQFGEVDWNFPASVWDVVMMGRIRHIGWFKIPLPGSIHHVAVKRALERVGLTKLAQRQIGELSGGEKRRVFIARALAQEADILLLDEPFAGVDAKAQETIIEVLDTLRQDNVTVLLATHDLMLAAEHFDRVMLINRMLWAFGVPDEVLKPDILAATYAGQLAIWNRSNQTYLVVVHEWSWW